MKTLTLSFSFSLRLLNSSIEQTDSDLRRVGGPPVESISATAELILGEDRTGSSRNQRDQQQDQPAEVYGALASSGPGWGGSLEGAGLMAGQGGWIEGHAEGHLRLTGQDNEHLSASMADKDSGHSFKGDEVDSSAWSIRSRASHGVSKDSDGGPDGDKSTGGDSSILVRDRGVAALTAKVSSGNGARGSSGEGSVEAGDGLSPGGGAFVLFRRDTARQPSTAQHTMVWCYVSILPAPWLSLLSRKLGLASC